MTCMQRVILFGIKSCCIRHEQPANKSECTHCNRAVTCHKEVVTVHEDTQYNIYYAPDVVTRALGLERLPSELKPAKYNLMGSEKMAVKFVRGKPGVKESRSETSSLKFEWKLGPENGADFFKNKQRHLFLQRCQWERRTSAINEDPKNVPDLETWMPAPNTATHEPSSKRARIEAPEQGSAGSTTIDAAGGDVVDAAGARALVRSLSDSSEPEHAMLGMSLNLANAKRESDRDEPSSKRPRYSKLGFELGSVEMELENMIIDKKIVINDLLKNMHNHETRSVALPQRIFNTQTGELKSLKTKAVASKNKDLAQDASNLALHWSIMDLFMKSIRDYGFELKTPRRGKAGNFLKKYIEAKKQCGQMFTDSLAPDVFTAYHMECGLQQIDERKYDFSEINLLIGEGSQPPMSLWEEEVRMKHQIDLATRVWDRAIFNSENSASLTASERYVPMVKWLSFLCRQCGPDDEVNSSMLCGVLGKSTCQIWRTVIARLCLFRSSVPVSLVGASFASPYGMLVRPHLSVSACILPCLRHSV